jgi:hypothetical protein
MPDTSRNYRNQRNNPYVLDGLAVTLHRTAAGVAWRWRTELTIPTAITAATWRLALLLTLTWAGVLVGLALIVTGVLPWTRRRSWCALARHRVHKLSWEARLHTRAGRLPLVLWTRPTKVGERLHLLCRAGTCAEDFEAHIGELRAACFARDAQITRNTQRWAAQNYTAAAIDPLARGVGWLLSETGVPRRIKTAYLSGADTTDLATYAAALRGHRGAA